jgi:hypothetical protein
MNPVFIFLVICIAVVVWFLLYKLFQPLGKLLNHIGRNAIDELNKEVPKIQGSNTSTIVDTRDMTADENAE